MSPEQPVSGLRPGETLSGRMHGSIAGIGRDAWARVFPASPHSWDYYAASERMAARGFTFGAVGAYRGDALVGAAPVFRLSYRLDEPLVPPFREVGRWVHRVAPSLITLPVLGMGSPISDECAIGIESGLDDAERSRVLLTLLAAMEADGDRTGTRILALKDVTERDRNSFASDFASAGFTAIPSLPTASLALPFASVDEYLASLEPKMRQDLRRKMRQSSRLRIEYRDSIEGVEDEIVGLYVATRANRKASYEAFDELPDGYFREVMRGLGGTARLQLLWVGDTLAAFNLFMVEDDRVVGKYLGMRYDLVREHNLYFANWIAMVRYCIDQRRPRLDVGQSAYALKVKLGCTLHRSWVYVRHTGRIRGPIIRFLAPYAAFDQIDPDLRRWGKDARYGEP